MYGHNAKGILNHKPGPVESVIENFLLTCKTLMTIGHLVELFQSKCIITNKETWCIHSVTRE